MMIWPSFIEKTVLQTIVSNINKLHITFGD